MKIKGLIIILIMILPFLTIDVRAEDLTDDVRKFAGTDALWEEFTNEEDRNSAEKLIRENSVPAFFELILRGIEHFLLSDLKNSVNSFLGLSAILIVGATFRSVKKTSRSQFGDAAFDLILIFSLVLYSFQALKNAVSLTTSTMTLMSDFMLMVLPITSLLQTMQGSLVASSVQQSGIRLFLSVISSFLSRGLLPMIKSLFSLICVGKFSNLGLGSLFDFLHKTIKRLIILSFTIVGAVIGLQNLLAQSKDSLAMRSVRFAAGNFIPIVGSMVGESAKTVSASIGIVKSECGILCLILIFFVIGKPITQILLQRFFFSLAGSLASMLEEKSACGFLQGIGKIYDLLLALSISQACFFIFYITLVIRSGGSL